MARTYKRDSRGRFSGGGGGSVTKGKGTLAARTSLKRSRAKLEQAPTAAQRGAVTRGQNKLRAAQSESRARLKGPSARFRPGKRKPAARLDAASNIRPLSRGATGAPRALRANAVRSFNPKSPRLRSGQLGRQISREMKDAPPSMKERLNTARGRVDAITARMDRRGARDITDRNSPDIGKRTVSEAGRNAVSNRPGVKVIQRRAQRAADAAARGSKPAQRARDIYNNQLAYTGKGRPKAAKSNLRPGPRNTQGPPPKPRKPRKPRP
jgi:hypothetical protein